VLLDAGTELDIVVGGAGINNFVNLFNGGGGGGSFVWDPIALPPQPVTAAVPETSTWAMMLAGFAGLAGRLVGAPRGRPRSSQRSPAQREERASRGRPFLTGATLLALTAVDASAHLAGSRGGAARAGGA
jgi:hypothetical protein